MSSTLARKFRFVSPGIFLREVDNSQLPRIPDATGPTIIGRYRKGPAMRPYKVSSLAEFVETFGNPIPGASSGDVWREGNKTGPTYAAYAAFAWLNAGVAPANIFRLLGTEHDQATTAGQAGWTTTTSGETSAGTQKDPAKALASNGGAYGLWIIPSGSDMENVRGTSLGTGSLAAVWYIRDGAFTLKGKQVSIGSQAEQNPITASCAMIHSEDSSYTFEGVIQDTSQNTLYTTKFNFDKTSENYIRKVFNTDPILTNTSVVDSTTVSEGKGNYWLGETFESNLFNIVGTSGNSYGLLLPLASGSGNAAASGSTATVGWHDHLEGFKNPESGWFFSQDMSTGYAHYAAERMTKLFKFHGLDSGEWLQNNIKISIADIKAPTSLSNPYGTFTIQIRRASDTDNVPVILEQYTNCNLNPASADYVAAKVGDMYMSFDYSTNRLREYGQYVNQSRFIRIEMNPSVENGTADPELLPFGVFGPIRPTSWLVRSNDGDDGATGTVVFNPFQYASSSAGSTELARATEAKGNRAGTFVVLSGDDNCNAIGALQHDQSGLTNIAFGASQTESRYKYTASYVWPATLTRISASDGGIGRHKEAYFGLQTGKTRTDITFDPGYGDYLRRLPAGYAQTDTITGPGADREYSWAFSLDDVRTENQTAQATCTITIDRDASLTGNSPDVIGAGDTITLVATNGTTVVCTINAAGGTTTSAATDGNVEAATDSTSDDSLQATAIAVNIKTAINYSNFFSATNSANVVTVTQRDAGSDGNTTVTIVELGAGAMTNTSFTGGTSALARSAFFQSGSRRERDSTTALGSSYKQILDEGYDRFTSPLYAGFDGWDVFEAEPLRNSNISSTDTQYTNYAYNTVKRAIDTCADPEFVETNLVTVPGLTAKNLTKHLIDTCEARADAMAVIDIEDVYTPFTENTNSFQSNVGTVASAISSLRSRDLNSSYAATYYPWVQIRDPNTSKLVWTPPSVVALGTYASSEAKSELWFAPAGFTRGGLTDGAAGLPVVNTTERLVRSDRDKLYTANINPIASFPSEGIVVFGQKTLQVTPSALDRINVRRLMIYIKKEISRIAAGVLFDQNVKATWARFLAQANPFLGSVMSRLGLTEFKVVLDETTTTPDLVDRNILYAKIFLKPARSIEFIAIDFVISRTGASFED